MAVAFANKIHVEIAVGLLFISPCRAEITLDGSLGPAGALAGPDFQIDANLGRQVGSNLFHSFSVFNVETGQSATFNDTGASGLVENILGRVTGVSGSSIDGTLSTAFANATPNLFLVNPNGISFGPNARLDVQGSFHASTADFIRLTDGVRFDALRSANDALLTTAPPAAFGFLGTTAGPITVSGSDLRVPIGEALSMIGSGDTEISSGVLDAPGGRITVAEVAGRAERALETTNLGQGLAGPTEEIVTSSERDVFIRSGAFTLAGGAVINTSTTTPEQGGNITITAAESVSILDRSVVGSVTGGPGDAGNILIKAEDVEFKGIQVTNASLLDLAGRAGKICIEAGQLRLSGDVLLDSSSFSGSPAGNIAINATESVTLSGPNNLISSTAFGAGDGGTISIATNELRFSNEDSSPSRLSSLAALGVGGTGGNIDLRVQNSTRLSGNVNVSTFTMGLLAPSPGNAGDISITTGDLLLTDGAAIDSGSEFSTGRGGDILITANNVDLTGGSHITAETSGLGPGGNVTVNAERVRADGFTIQGNDESQTPALTQISTSSRSTIKDPDKEDSARAGDLVVNADAIEVSNGAQILASTFGPGRGGNLDASARSIVLQGAGGGSPSGLFVTTEGTTAGSGNGGDLSVTTDTLRLSNGGTVSARTFGPGDGGTITIDARDIEISNTGNIAATSSSEQRDAGESGQIVVRANENLRLLNGGTIAVGTARANARNIDVNTGFLLHLRDQSSITTSVAGGQGDGGDITIDPVFTVLDSGSRIIAQAREGRGGAIRIGPTFLFRSPDSQIDASSESGVSGTVEIESPDTDVISGALALPESFLDAASLLSDRCSARTAKGVSSFIVRGQGGVPPGPDVVLPGYLYYRPETQSESRSLRADEKREMLVNSLPLECGPDRLVR